MSRKTDYIISLEATTEWPLTHFRALKNKELRVSDRGKVNASRVGCGAAATSDDAQETPRACNAIFITRRERAWEKMTNSCFPARRRPPAPRFIPVVIFIRGRGTRRKLDRNVFTSRLFIKPSTAKQIRSVYTSLFALLSGDNVA